MNHVILLQEQDFILSDFNQPSMVRQSRLIGALHAEARLECSRRNFDVAALSNANNFGTDPEGVAEIL
jgi:hypothetical protein